MKKPLLLAVIFLFTLGISSASAMYQNDTQATTAPTGKKINFQGTLYENSLPVTGDRQFTFTIDLGDGQSWTETQTTSVLNGLYSVVLGAVTPLPYDLFYESDERTIQVSIGNTVLGSSVIYAPFALKNDEEEFGTAIFQLEAKGVTDTVALTGEIYGVGNKSEYAAGLRGFAHTDTTANTGVSGIAFGGTDNKRANTAVRGDSYSNTPEAWSTGVWGISNASGGGISYGIRGEARGQGSTFSAAMRGLNFVEPGEDGLRYGGFFNTYSAANSPFNGESVGVRGSATGSMSNVGVWGTANGAEGTDNWAGRFDGNVAIRDGAIELSQEGQSFARISRNEQNSGSIALKSSVDSLSVLIDSNGEKAGLIHLYDSLGRESIGMFAFAGNGAQMRMSAGIPNSGETRVTTQLVSTLNPFINLIGRDADGNATGRAQMGNLAGNQGAGFRVTAPDFRSLVNIEGNADNGGSISLEGPNSSNFWIGQKNWEDSNLAFMGMRGAYAEDDGNGNFYNPDLLSLETTRWEDGTELGQINFSKTTENGLETLSLNYDEVNSLLNSTLPQPFNGGYLGNDNGPNINIKNDSDFGLLEVFGNTQISDNQGGTYFPSLAQVGATENGGVVNLYDTEGDLQVKLSSIGGKGQIELLDKNGQFNSLIENDRLVLNRTQASGIQGKVLLSPDAFIFGVEPGLNGITLSHNEDTGSTLAIRRNSVSVFAFDSNTGNLTISGSLSQSSDARLKKNVTTLTSGLATVNRLRGVSYNWLDESRPENKIGFIAQEVEKVLPELVMTKEDGFKAVNYAEMTAVLVEAVKELNAKVEKLEAENNGLKAQRSELKAEVEKVELLAERLAQIEALLNSANPNKVKK